MQSTIYIITLFMLSFLIFLLFYALLLFPQIFILCQQNHPLISSMETPSSTRRITRSQSKAVHSNIIPSSKTDGKNEESKQRSCLIDITNGSPIVGLATAKLSETRIASVTSNNRCKRTPGSGEALLRGQVKSLLQQVEEAAEISKLLSFDTVSGRHGLKAFLNSPAGLRAPTPANTPQVLNFNSALDGFDSLESPPIEDQLTVSKVVNGMIEGKGLESEKEMRISRSLFMDFSEKSVCSSVMTFQGSGETLEKRRELKNDDEDDTASTWSIQVNASTGDEDEEGEEEEEETKSEVVQLEELCEGIKKIGMNDDDDDDDDDDDECLVLRGKLIRFVYDSDDELIHEDQVLRLKGLPTPKGKHLRFRDEQEEEDDE